MVAAITGVVVPGNKQHFCEKLWQVYRHYTVGVFAGLSNQKKFYEQVALECSFDEYRIAGKFSRMKIFAI